MFTMGHISVTLIVPRKLIKQTAYLIQTVGSILMGVDKVMTTSIWLKYLSKCLRKGALFIQFFLMKISLGALITNCKLNIRAQLFKASLA